MTYQGFNWFYFFLICISESLPRQLISWFQLELNIYIYDYIYTQNCGPMVKLVTMNEAKAGIYSNLKFSASVDSS